MSDTIVNFPLRCVTVTNDTTNCQHSTDDHTSSDELPVGDTVELMLLLSLAAVASG